ncbi:hypothetical protein [Nitrosospira sp. Nsp2]|uniref:hypothetical protein n=2 Tax=unclassified Nitrosospira TaxID=2609267 RepID=UPI0011B1DBA1|nr:hypothetical protein [Nitrosospira sp. Nsp2]
MFSEIEMRNRLLKVLLPTSLLLAVFPVFAAQQAGKAPPEAAISCIQNVIDERDTSLANMAAGWSSSVKEALEARRDAEKASWEVADYKGRRVAQRKAWGDYDKVLRAANKTKTKERVQAWKKFDNDRQQCEVYSPEMVTGSTVDKNI